MKPEEADAVPQERMARYRTTLHRRAGEEQRRQKERKKQARGLARRAARRLKRRYGATRVVLFGSVATETRLSERSDIDLAVWGLAPEQHLDAMAALRLPAFRVDLICAERAPTTLRNVIRREGVEL